MSTKPIPRLGIPEFIMTDGPHGSRAQISRKEKNTYFPATIGLAASWNTELAYRYGQFLAEETRAVGRHCILAPGVNIHRTPFCGRNFEYLSEDPCLAGRIVAPLIKGIQSKRIAACVKHFVCNNSEKRRRFSNSIVSERALEEIYFPAFKSAVVEGNSWMVMGAYNKVNGKYVYESKYLLNDKLRKDWGFKGFVVSDWLATHAMTSASKCLKAGLTLEMPNVWVYSHDNVKKDFDNGEFDESILDEHIRRLLRVFFYVGLFDPEDKIPNGERNTEKHIELAQKIIEDGSVLLKNENNILPINLNKISKIYMTGPLADYKPIIPIIDSLAGSSSVIPFRRITVMEALKEMVGNKVEFVDKPEDAHICIIVTGIKHRLHKDNEGSDKERLDLAERKINEIKQIAARNKNTIVVLFNGGPIGMIDWIDEVPAILEAWQPHQEAGYAIANLLLGHTNPSGKLPTTFPKKISDSPAHKSEKRYPSFHYSLIDLAKHEGIYVHPKRTHKGQNIDLHYEEDIFVGYRYFDTENIEPLFPFGHGLSYTSFEYSNLEVDKKTVNKTDTILLSLDVKNNGDRKGAEIIQIYSKDLKSSVARPEKELIAFKKVELQPEELKNVKIKIDVGDLAYYNEKEHKWKLEKGDFQLLIGSSSKDIRLKGTISLS
ncbi:MAG: glycosyl hydrolase [Candidatus Lokiarchaeota archaeon]|nr:glycosyl hydrolase [Candidatus Lokiarchaeota archaeon]